MKGIKCCGECAYYNMKKHKCTGGAKDPGKAEDSFYTDCPHVEAEPVRHGRWIECDYKELRHGEIWTEHRAGLCCSECRTAFHKKKMTYKQYCAACGAKMDGGAENDS